MCNFSEWDNYETGAGMVPDGYTDPPCIVAIDGPQGLAGFPERTMRSCERLLGAAGKSTFSFPILGRPFAGFVRGSVELFYRLQLSKDCRLYGMPGVDRFQSILLEVYPGAAWKTLAGHALPKKTSPGGRIERFKILKSLGLTFPQFVSGGLLSHDELDAGVAAYIAYLFSQNKTVDYGEPPFEDASGQVLREGFIVQPVAGLSCGQ
jgi:hypothetical protein